MNFTSSLKTLLLAIILSIGIGYAYAAWAPPTTSPTGGNAEAPLNTGGATQLKAGGLGVNGLLTAFSGLKIGNTSVACDSGTAGMIKYTGADMFGCINSGGIYEWKSLTTTGGGGGGGNPPPPTVSLSYSDADGKIPIEYSTTLSWISTDATACAVETSSAPGWSGGKALVGSEPITPSNAGNNTYTLTCTNASGSASDSVTIDVRPWTTVSGYGSTTGQSCRDWLSASGQAGIDGSPPRIYITSSNAIAIDSCGYDTSGSNSDSEFFGLSCTGLQQDQTGNVTPIGTCGYYGEYLTQTRR